MSANEPTYQMTDDEVKYFKTLHALVYLHVIEADYDQMLAQHSPNLPDYIVNHYQAPKNLIHSIKISEYNYVEFTMRNETAADVKPPDPRLKERFRRYTMKIPYPGQDQVASLTEDDIILKINYTYLDQRNGRGRKNMHDYMQENNLTKEYVESIINDVLNNTQLQHNVYINKNEKVPNRDFRGTTLLDWTFPWVNEVNLKMPNLQDVVKGMIMMKSHKWDSNYEMVMVFKDDELLIDFNEYHNNVIITLNMDYGS